MPPPPAEYDHPWKEALARYLEDFFRLFFPHAGHAIDWTKAPRFLDTELRQIAPDAETGTQHVDALLEVYLQGGGDAWVLAHVELQSQVDPGFAERMYLYNGRIYDRFRRRVASMAVLAIPGRSGARIRSGMSCWGAGRSWSSRSRSCSISTSRRGWRNGRSTRSR